jgi:short-subunit dehydrogenase
MAHDLKMNQDEPEAVAARVITAIEKNGRDIYLGWPESLFVRINALLPRLMDKPLMKQADQMRPYALDASR